MKLRNTEEPQKVAAQLTSSIDSVLAGISTQWLSSLSTLGSEIRESACILIQAGEGGISRATDYVDRARQEFTHALSIVLNAEAAQAESSNQIVAKMNQLFTRKDTKKNILTAEGLPYLRAQTLIMLRKTIALKCKADLSAATGKVESYRSALQHFGLSANTLLAKVQKESQEKIAAKQNTLGTQSVAVDVDEVKKNFAKNAESFVSSFFRAGTSARVLRRLAEGVLDGNDPGQWGPNLLQSADEFLRANLAEKAAVPSDWYQRAAEKIIDCQPLVQFIADHNNFGAEGPRKILVARAYGKEVVAEATRSTDPLLDLRIFDSTEPGSVEVTTVVLNFGLYQLQELKMIEEGFKQWSKNQAESSENRYAWRGPERFWKRLLQTGIFPLSKEKQALVRVLAFAPVPPSLPIAVQKTETYVINNQILDTDSDSSWQEKYQRFNNELLSTGLAEQLLQGWTDADPISARSHAEALIGKLQKRITDASELEDADQDFIDMLREELAALQEAVRKLPV